MTTRRFLLTVSVSVMAIAVCFVLAELLDLPWLRVAALPLLLVIGITREAWIWRGDGRGWLIFHGGLIMIVVIAFVAQRLSG